MSTNCSLGPVSPHGRHWGIKRSFDVNHVIFLFLLFQTRNEPKNVCISCQAISRIKGVPVHTVYEETTKNALKLFPKLQRFIRKWWRHYTLESFGDAKSEDNLHLCRFAYCSLDLFSNNTPKISMDFVRYLIAELFLNIWKKKKNCHLKHQSQFVSKKGKESKDMFHTFLVTDQ